MKKVETLIRELNLTYLDRFCEKLSYVLSKNLNQEVSSKEVLSGLADEIAFTDDGYLFYMIDTEFNIDLAEDMRFKIEHIKKSNNYVLLINNEIYNIFDCLSSTVKRSIEDYFN